MKQNQDENSIRLHTQDVGCINYMKSLGLTVKDKEVKKCKMPMLSALVGKEIRGW